MDRDPHSWWACTHSVLRTTGTHQGRAGSPDVLTLLLWVLWFCL